MQQHEYTSPERASRSLRWVTDKAVPAKAATVIVGCFRSGAALRGAFAGLVFLVALAGMPAANAGEVDVIGAKAYDNGDGSWTISATLRHADSGWDHYADRWEVTGPEGKVLAVRSLAHPHVDEQPFTRSLSNIAVPEGITAVTIRAHDSVHGYGGKEFDLQLDQ